MQLEFGKCKSERRETKKEETKGRKRGSKNERLNKIKKAQCTARLYK
jgi:hypothetical protein